MRWPPGHHLPGWRNRACIAAALRADFCRMKTTSRSLVRCLLLGAVAFSAASCVEVGYPYRSAVVVPATTTRVYAPAPVVVAPAPVIVAPRRAARRYWW